MLKNDVITGVAFGVLQMRCLEVSFQPVVVGVFLMALKAHHGLWFAPDIFLQGRKLLLPRRYSRPLLWLSFTRRWGV